MGILPLMLQPALRHQLWLRHQVLVEDCGRMTLQMLPIDSLFALLGKRGRRLFSMGLPSSDTCLLTRDLAAGVGA